MKQIDQFNVNLVIALRHSGNLDLKVIETNRKVFRRHFTHHGLHLNIFGKQIFYKDFKSCIDWGGGHLEQFSGLERVGNYTSGQNQIAHN